MGAGVYYYFECFIMKIANLGFGSCDFALCSLNTYYDLSTYSSVCKFTQCSFNSVLIKFNSSFILSFSSLLNSSFVNVLLSLNVSCCSFEFSLLMKSLVTSNLSWLSVSFVVLGLVSVLFFDWDVVITLGSNCFLYSSVLVFDIMFIKLLFGKIVSPIGLIFNIYDRDILLRFS